MYRQFAISFFAACSCFSTVYENFEYSAFGNQITITRYIGTNSQVLVPHEIGGNSVTTLMGKEIDTYSNNIALYLKFDSMPLSDSSSSGTTIILGGDTHLDSTNPKLGSASIFFDGVGDTLEVSHQRNLNFETEDDFTIEGWINYSEINGHPPVASKGSQSTSSGWSLYFDNEHKLLRFGVPHISNDIGASFVPSTNRWYHIACTRSQGTLKLFIDGKLSATENGANRSYSTSENVKMGVSHSGHMLHGYLDEIKITKGISRYSGDFIPFRGAFPNLEQIGTITIPESVAQIDNTFFGMQQIDEIIFLGDAPNLQTGIGFNIPGLNLLVLPGKMGSVPMFGGKSPQEITASQILSSPHKVRLFTSSQMSEQRLDGIAAGVFSVTNNPNLYHLYQTNQILNMGLGGLVLNRSTNNQLELKYQVLQSSNLTEWQPYEEFSLPITNAPSNKFFLRIKAVDQ